MFSYRPHFIPNKIILIGAGGTGSRLMPVMTQLVKTCLRKHNPLAHIEDLSIFVIDGDVVEEKNLVRQNFIARDVGRNKAVVVAERYGNAFGVPVYAETQFITADTSLSGLFPQYKGLSGGGFGYEYSVVIFAVDSAQARRDILANITRHTASESPIFFIDAGNEDAFGQVKWFTNHVVRMGNSHGPQVPSAVLRTMPSLRPAPHEVMYIPYDEAYYAELGSSAAEISCAELPQTLAINNMMATMIGCVLQNFLLMKSMTYDGMRFHMNGSMSTDMNTLERWTERENTKTVRYFTPAYLAADMSQYRNTLKEMFQASGVELNSDGSLLPIPQKPPEVPALTPISTAAAPAPRVKRPRGGRGSEASSAPPQTEGAGPEEGVIVLAAEIPPLTPLTPSEVSE